MDPTWKQTAHNAFAFVAFKAYPYWKGQTGNNISPLVTDYATYLSVHSKKDHRQYKILFMQNYQKHIN